ncbi:DUF2787 family protein [Shewanella sp. SM96]|nr:DUF2787 family protein [Shewanella sp. SM96]MCU8061171.1 DUF2787 family protein [Shewanella sp. SM55]
MTLKPWPILLDHYNSLFSGWIGERECRALIDLFTQNFATYFDMGVYKVKVSLD